MTYPEGDPTQIRDCLLLLSVAVLIVTRQGKVVGMTRGADRADVNLPGGMVEEGDVSLASAAARELLEETGIEAGPLHPVLTARSGPELPTLCTAFVPTAYVSWPPRLASSPFEGYPGLYRPADLLRDSCSFRYYNERLFAMVWLL